MRNYSDLPDLSMDVDHEKLVLHTAVWLSAPRLTSDKVDLLTRSCMTTRSAACFTRGCPYLACRSEAYLARLLCDKLLRG